VANASRRLPANAPGDLFVDDRCIACDTCRQLAPDTFGGGEDDLSFVSRQPTDAAARRRALLALVSCPVAAIGSGSKAGVAEAAAALPVEHAPGVLRCGYAAESSFGATAWLLLRREGNVMVDSPRFAGPLVRRIRALGGIRLLFLTHRDDVADHARWQREFGCERILHARDVTRGTREAERQLEGDEPVAVAPDLLAVPVPGHTAGSTALLHHRTGGAKPPAPPGPPLASGQAHPPAPPLATVGFLFTGDHLWGEADGRLHASRSVCWYDWALQASSMARLAQLELGFEHVLPGHGRPWRAGSPAAAREAVRALAEEMRARR
jgi:glyoxylase-like metal-dependent hydrolase (beta-lactamase superfamily II)/ferredoxin